MSNGERYDPDSFAFDIEPIYQDEQGQQVNGGVDPRNTNLDSHVDSEQMDENENKIFDILDLDKFEESLNHLDTPTFAPLQDILNELQDLQNNPFHIQLPEQPQLPQQLQNIPIQAPKVFDAHIFNNLPGFLLGAIQSLRNQIQYDGLLTDKFQIMNQIQVCFKKLKEQVLMPLSSKYGNRSNLRMLFNDVDHCLNNEIKNKAKLNKAEKKYLELLQIFSQQVMNETKNLLRNIVYNCMTRQWIHNHARSRQFKVEEELKKEVFEKYMNYFRQQLSLEGHISTSVIRNKVLSIPLFHY